jgi:uncharacterized protein with PQ loop repeat
MLLLWTQADILSLIGTIVLNMHFSIILIGWYHYIVGAIMILFVLYYKDKYNRYKDNNDDEDGDNNDDNNDDNLTKTDTMMNFKRKFIVQMISTFIFLSVNTLVCVILNTTINEPNDVVGECLGWVTMSFYLIGRFPQMWLNYKRKSTEGLSLLMYLFTMLGNGFYMVVITIDPETIRANIPWIVTGITTILLDIVVIGQHYYYKNHYKKYTIDTTQNTNNIENDIENDTSSYSSATMVLSDMTV